MFVSTEEIESCIYPHVMDEIVNSDRSIVLENINVAVSIVRGYLSKRYDVTEIFAAEGDNRNPLVVEFVKVIAVWHLIKLCNNELIYDQWKDRYDRALDFLKDVADDKSAVEIEGAPLLSDDDGNALSRIKCGSNPKFNHSF